VAGAVDARRGRFLLVLLGAAHLVAISHQVDGGEGASLLQRGLFSLLYPFEWAVATATRTVREAAASYVDLRGVRAENVRLREQVGALETLLQQKQDRVREADRLREVLALQEVLPLKAQAALVVARDGLPFYRVLTIDRGSDHGVVLDAPVISPTGVVGRVIRVFPRAASVQLLLDAQSGVGVLFDRTRVMGVASGRSGPGESGPPDLEVRYVAALADVAVGDVVLTSGLDGVFPKGLAVGRVRFVGAGTGLFKEVRVEPSARFATLEEVLVLKVPPEEASAPLPSAEAAR
jgi:rod shape-determining protein MreC